MGLEGWNGYEAILNPGHEPDEYVHVVFQETPEYIREHERQVRDAQLQFDLLYGDMENLLEPETEVESGYDV